MRKSPLLLTTAAFMAIGAVAAASAADVPPVKPETTASAETGAAGANANGSTGAIGSTGATPNYAELDAQLAAARAQLEQAAHEVAEISAQMSKPLVDNFMQFGMDGPPRAVIGVQLDTNSGKEGARVQEVSPGGPAADAGVHVGDVIVAINGADVKGDNPARQVLHQMRHVDPDSKVKITVVRDGKPHEFVVTARPGAGYYMGMHEHGPRPPRPPRPPNGPGENGFGPNVPGPDGPGSNGPGKSGPGSNGGPFDRFDFAQSFMIRGPLGELQLVTLSPQLGRYFGTDKGVLVVRAPKEEGFKLEDGDVILAIDGREPTTGTHATRILGSYQPGEKISIKLMRQHKTLSVETTLPERRGPEPRQSDRKVQLEHLLMDRRPTNSTT